MIKALLKRHPHLDGGAESMTRSPWVLMKPDNPLPVGDNTAVSTALGWRLINKRMPPEWTVSLGESNEQLREKFNIARERQDAFAYRSHRLAHQPWQDGFYDDIVTSVPEIVLARDEGIRSDTTPEKLAALKPSFRPDGTITAGNTSALNDGASALLMGSELAATRIGGDSVARIAGRGAAGVDLEILNTRGGAIAIGHPLGASGGRILGTLAKVLREGGYRWGVAAICIGVGQGLAVVLENLNTTRRAV